MRNRYNILLLLLFPNLCATLTGAVLSAATDIALASPLDDLNQQCGFEGNSDIYGLGIRLGLYMQWMSAYLTCQLLPENTSELMDVTTIFEFALFVATAVLTKMTPPAHAIEIVIMVAMFTSDVWVGHIPVAFSLYTHPRNKPIFSPLGLVLRASLCVAMAAFAVWFAKDGCFDYRRDPCGTYLFLFAKIRVRGWVLIDTQAKGANQIRELAGEFFVFRAVSVINLMLVLFISGITLVGLFQKAHWRNDPVSKSVEREGKLVGVAHFIQVSVSRPDPKDPRMDGFDQSRRLGTRILRYLLPILMAFFVLNIELILSWNSISGIYSITSTGQLIPFIMGIGGLVKVLNQIINKHISKTVHRDDCGTHQETSSTEDGFSSSAAKERERIEEIHLNTLRDAEQGSMESGDFYSLSSRFGSEHLTHEDLAKLSWVT